MIFAFFTGWTTVNCIKAAQKGEILSSVVIMLVRLVEEKKKIYEGERDWC